MRQATAAHNKGCFHGQGGLSRQIRGLQLQITSANDEWGDPECRLKIRDSNNRPIVSEDDWSLSVLHDDLDVDGDGTLDLVIEGYSGGAHCCWTYYIVSTGANARLLLRFENEREAGFFLNKESGRIEIGTWDGAFDYFDGLCHGCTPFPTVYLRMHDGKLIDISSEYVSVYDVIIADSNRALAPEDRQTLRSLAKNPSEAEGSSGRAAKALAIVFAYLYSGRKEQARKSLEELWPRFDVERVWGLIEQTRRNGILRYTRGEMRSLS